MAAQEKQPSKAAQVAGAAADSAANKVIFATKKTVGNAINVAATAAATATGILAPIAKPIGAVLGRIGEWVTLKAGVFIKRHKGAAAAAIAAPVLLLIGGIGGIPAAVGGGLFIVAGMIVAAFGGAIVGASLGFFMVAGLILLFFVAFTLFIINMGGYVVPVGPPIGSTTSISGIQQIQSEYIDVVKTADRPGPFQNGDLPLNITYTITVRAKKGPLTNIKFGNSCTVTKRKVTAGVGNPNEAVTGSCPQPVPDSTPTEIPAGGTYTWSYQSQYGGDYADALIADSFAVTATASGVTTTATGTALIRIGNPPTSCFTFEGAWPGKEQRQVVEAIGWLSASVPSYLARLCTTSRGTREISLVATSLANGWGRVADGKIYFHVPGGGLKNLQDAVYILLHESGHILQGRYGSLFLQYETQIFSEVRQGGWAYLCTYPLAPRSASGESFAEMIADYVVDAPNGSGRPPGIASFNFVSCLANTNFKAKYPKHWNFVNTQFINERLGW